MVECLHGYRKFETGKLKLFYGNGEIRRISVGKVQVLNAVYAAVRDQNWGTVPFRITSENIKEGKHGFSIHLELEYRDAGIQYDARMDFEASEQNLKVSFQGQAQSSVLRNRIGICVLHPIRECTGKAVQLIHPDGNSSLGRFPERISPHQPFANISGMTWEAGKGIAANLVFKGEVFEAEDQRNWTDASFKTYGTPLDLPFPVRIEKGDLVEQSLSLEWKAEEPVQDLSGQDTYTLRIDPDSSHPLPALGCMRSSEKSSLNLEEARCLQDLSFQHYRVDLRLANEGWESHYEQITQEQKELGWPLELALHFGSKPGKELQAFLKKQNEQPAKIKCLLLFDHEFLSGNSMLQELIPSLRKALSMVAIGGGTDAYFAELNRNRPDGKHLDFISFSICPQVHAFDNLTLLENLEAQSHVVESARELFGKDVSIGALSLKQRFNAVATDEDKELSLPETDHRQHTHFAAGWTLGSFKQLALAGADSINYYETVGPRGILSREGKPQESSPLFHLFKELSSCESSKILSTQPSHPLEFDAVCLKGTKELKVLLSNHRKSSLHIVLEGITWKVLSFSKLGHTGWENQDKNEINKNRITMESEGIYKILYTL